MHQPPHNVVEADRDQPARGRASGRNSHDVRSIAATCGERPRTVRATHQPPAPSDTTDVGRLYRTRRDEMPVAVVTGVVLPLMPEIVLMVPLAYHLPREQHDGWCGCGCGRSARCSDGTLGITPHRCPSCVRPLLMLVPRR